ncbi:MAG TPA: CbtA family protein [Nocardioidaceae bacterium]|nr:CbtA family protein [Nocardioidaceae bacterium]
MRFSVLLRNGALAGFAAGVVAALLQWLVTEPVIRRALALEERVAALESHEPGHHGDGAAVERGAQVVAGMLTAGVVAVLFGIVFAIVFARTRHRLPGLSDFGRAAWLAAFGFFAFTLMPALTIPSNPPAVGNPDTIERRTLIYVLAILVGLLIIGAVAALNRALEVRVDPARRLAANAVAFAMLVAVALLVIPSSPDSIPTTGDASLIAGADLIWDFRLASLLQIGAMWAVLGLAFGMLTSTPDSENTPVVAHASAS